MNKTEELKLFLKENGVKIHEVDSKRNYCAITRRY